MENCKLILGDCLEKLKEIPDNSVNVVLTDPPYNIGIDKWDKIKDYHNWIMKSFKECERVLKDNGTLWFFHTRFDDLVKIHELLINETDFRHKQMVVIHKGLQSVAGRTSEALRSFPKATEYLQFYTFEDLTGAEQLNDVYSKINPFAKYLKSEFKKANVSTIQVAEFGKFYGKINHGGSVSNWMKGYNIPSKEQYLKIRTFLNSNYLLKKYEYLHKEYEDLRKEYEDSRYTFNSMSGFTDVWNINFYKEKKFGHCTQKPQTLMERIVKTCSNENDLILDPFMGSGSTGVASLNLKRKFIGIEINSEYFKIAKERIEESQKQTNLRDVE